jgi:hypothetical protein
VRNIHTFGGDEDGCGKPGVFRDCMLMRAGSRVRDVSIVENVQVDVFFLIITVYVTVMTDDA